jgi:hypothetical protein
MDNDIMDYGLYKDVPFWVILLDDTYCMWIYNRTSLPKEGRKFQNYLVAKKRYSEPVLL